MRDIDPAQPGEVLLEDFVKPMGITQCRLAKSIKMSASRIRDVVHGKRPEIDSDPFPDLPIGASL